MAEVGAVYDVTPVVRTASDVMASKHAGAPSPAPKARGKWVTASVAQDAAQVVGRVFEEAGRRDPHHQRRWVALVDGNNHQIDRIEAEADARGVTITIVIDLIHVLEYIWASAWCFFADNVDRAIMRRDVSKAFLQTDSRPGLFGLSQLV